MSRNVNAVELGAWASIGEVLADIVAAYALGEKGPAGLSESAQPAATARGEKAVAGVI